MADLSRSKCVHLIGTGILLVLLSTSLFGLLYIVHGDEYEFGKSDIFDKNTAFWAVIPITATGLLGVLAGTLKSKPLIKIYLAVSLISTCLSCMVSIAYGLRVTSIRVGCGEDSTCKNSDTAVLIGTVVLLAGLILAISLLAVVRACQALWGPSKNQKKKRYLSTAHFTKATSNGAGSTTVPVVITSQRSAANGTCHACGGIINPAVNTVDKQRSSGYDTNGSTNHGNDSSGHIDQSQPDTRVEVVIQNTTDKDHGTDTAKDDSTTDTAKDDGTNDTAKDDGTTDTAKDDGTTDTAKDDGTTDTAKDDGTTDTAKDDGTTDTAKDDGTIDTAKDDCTTGTAKDNGTSSTVKDDVPHYVAIHDDVSQVEKDRGTTSIAKDDGSYYATMDDDVSQEKVDGSNSGAKDDGTTSVVNDEGPYYSIPDPVVDGTTNHGEIAKSDGNSTHYASLDDNTRINVEYESLDNKTKEISQQQQENRTATQVNEGYVDDEEISTAL